MESIAKTVDELSQHFNKTMAEFQQNLTAAIPATSPTSNIAAQFNTFRSFVLTALTSLQGQVELLSQQMDHQETMNRRKILIVHGIPEVAKEDVPATVIKVLTDHLRIPELSAAAISRCHRMGQPIGDKCRPMLVKFHNLSVRNTIWYGKRKFKGSGITLAEFLTKNRHEAFMAARQKFGISKCWTKNGQIVVIDSVGKRHCITSKGDLCSISAGNNSEEVISAQVGPAAAVPKPKAGSSQVSRPKRVLKK